MFEAYGAIFSSSNAADKVVAGKLHQLFEPILWTVADLDNVYR